jgi:hypothetical protein
MSEWRKSSESLPPVGHEVIVYRREEFDVVRAIARIEESDDGEAYWESDSDVVHGMPVDYMTHWTELPDDPE